jgi:signal transduction histidine kinase
MTTDGGPTASHAQKLRLLAIDDDPRILQMMSAVLGGTYDLTVASDGERGLSLALSSRPDLILTDFNMPKMTGQQMLLRLRQETSLEDVPVIVLTGHEDDQLRVDLLRNGAQDFLVKPFRVEELRVRIANLLRVKQARELLQEELQSRECDLGALIAEVAARRAALQAAVEIAQIARAQAEKASQAKTNFLTLVSHELRTPLTVLGLIVARWRRRFEGAGGAVDTEVQRMATALDRLKAIVDGVIDYTTTRTEPRPDRIDLAALIGGLHLEFDAKIVAKGLRFDVEVAEEARDVTLDARIVRLILSNLIANAIKFTDSGFIQLRAFIESGLVLTVGDSGRGIDPLDGERIFEPFEYGGRIENKGTPGVGLGLALVRDLVAVLGGRLAFTSQEGVGSTFTVTLPAL